MTKRDDDSRDDGRQKAPRNDTQIYINGFPVTGVHLRRDLKRGGEVIAHNESYSPGDDADASAVEASEAVVLADGSIVSERRGAPGQGETRTERVCRALAAVWRDRGRPWLHIRLAEPHDDCDCLGFYSRDAVARIQVVRADSSQAVYRALQAEGRYGTRAESLASPAQVLAEAIHKKASRIPRVQRPALILALDAMEASGLVLGPVVRHFREHHGATAADYGFREVWVVGPGPATTYRLDQRDDGDAV